MIELVMAAVAGVALASACGFRVFLPLLAASLGAQAGYLHPSPGFAWLGSEVAVGVFVVATIVEVGGYFVPWVDHALDALATPASVVAGAVVAAAAFGDMDPVLKWTAAAVAGGGAAGVVQAGTVAGRALTRGVTGGSANRLFSSIEMVGAAVMSVLAIVVPVIALVAVVVLFVVVARLIWRWRRGAAAVTPVPVG